MLHFLRLQIVFEALENIELPPFAGSSLRGAFMGVLKDQSCMAQGPADSCKDFCQWTSTCAYGLLCETPAPKDAPGRLRSSRFAPHPYVITPFPGGLYMQGDLLRCSMRLWGEGPRQLPRIIKALEAMEAEGVGKGRRSLRLLRIIDETSQQPIYTGGRLDLTGLQRSTFDPGHQPNSEKTQAIKVNFLTPLQVQRHGKPQKTIDFGELVYAAADRLWVIGHCHGAPQIAPDARALAQKARQADIQIIDDQSAYMSFSRFSHRQNRRHELGGIAGSMSFIGELTEFLPLLRAGEVFHLGKGTSFGLGAIELEIKASPSLSNS